MKCPKCGYLGFETTDRCRHCGYDFSLALPLANENELPLRPQDPVESPLADFDLDRIIGAPSDKSSGDGPDPDLLISGVRPKVGVAVQTPPSDELETRFAIRPGVSESADTAVSSPRQAPVSEPTDADGLPLFRRRSAAADDAPMTPPPARAPLAVRRATPEVTRRRTPRTIRREADAFEFDLDATAVAPSNFPVEARSAAPAPLVIASAVRRIAASAVDFLLVAAVDVAVLYFTLAVTGLSLIDIFVIPAVPMLAFLMLLNGGYLVAFIAASGQTIGKMLTGIRVVNHDGGRVDVPGALLRAAGVLLAVVTFGLPYLPVLVSGEKRALHDRLAGTRVIRHV